MIDALWITLIGMGLVFAAILFLWGMMALLVRLTAEPQEAEVSAPEPEAEGMVEQPVLTDRKRRVAVAAVAFALSMRKPVQPARESEPGSLSAWQSVNRASRLSQRINSPRKKGIL
jgi:Na+-transporting methylmalonyl-CoA/oxaloacetate decarboxylase gamma subunit